MSKYAVNEEGIQALKSTASNIIDAVEQLLNITNSIESVADEYVETLGPHYTSLVTAIAEIRETQKQAIQPAFELSEMLNDVADAYQDIIDNDRVSAGNKGTATPGNSPGEGSNDGSVNVGKVTSFFGKIFNGTNKQFNGYDVEKQKNGVFFIKGTRYERFKESYYNSENFSYEEINGGIVENISPDLIEGVHVSENDLKDPQIFWTQHMDGGTPESFREIASHIPEVKREMDAGRTIDDLENDPVLGPCTSIYFDPKNIVKVEKWEEGFYFFAENGRHRILAARDLGYNIPVKVIGIRRRK